MEKFKGITKGLTNYGDPDFSRYLRRSFAASMGWSREELDRPIVGIAYTASGYNNCHRHFPELLDALKRGVIATGGLPIAFPTISLGEVFLAPTSLMYRNLMSIDTEEMIRAQPMDSVVLMGGCDKTLPAQLMGACSANLPAITLVAGPMMTSRFQGERLGACTDCRRYWARYRAGEIATETINIIESRLATTAGTCAVMGTASTMACLVETMGMALPRTAAIPAVHADRLRAAEATGRAAVALIDKNITPSQIITEQSLENALRILVAIGGSTNAIVHLTAIAGRLGIRIPLQQLNRISEETPVLVKLKPTGTHYMEDFFAAGGMEAVLLELKDHLHLNCLTVTGKTLGEILQQTFQLDVDRQVIASYSDPHERVGGLVALFGNLAPRGAILKRSAANPDLFESQGTAVVFESPEDLSRRIDDPNLRVSRHSFLILKNAGPTSPDAMPEAGNLPIPKKLAQNGVEDMVRISDARMSGTSYGTIVLHVTPDSASGGPLSWVKNGDRIRLSVKERKLELLVDEAELEKRKSAAKTTLPLYRRGYRKLYQQTILQADEGCDFNFLQGFTG